MKELVIVAPMAKVWTLLDDVKKLGLVKGVDYQFSYFQAKVDTDTYQEISPSQVTFKFNDDKWATLFSLRWA